MVNWTLYEKRLEINGNTTRDRQINNMKDAIIDEFEDNPSYRSAYFNESTSSTGIQIIDDAESYIKKILMKPDDSLDVGDIITFDGFTWICIDVDKTNPVYEYGIVQKATQTISLYKNGILSQVNCIVLDRSNSNDTQIRYNLNKYVLTIDCDAAIVVSSNARNLLIEAGDVFQIGKYSYEVIKPDDLSKSGLIILPMKFVENDQESHTFVVNILNGSSVNIQQGTTLQLNVEVTDNGTPLSSPTIIYSSGDITIATVSSTGLVTALDVIDNCIITATANGVSDTISINVITSEQHNYTYSLSSVSTPDTEIRVNQTKTYVAYKYDNGTSITQTFTFSVSGESSAYTLTTVDGNNCTIKALKANYTIVLSATDNSDGSKITTKSIDLKSIF